jgi:malonate decarboxylase gamma subunit
VLSASIRSARDDKPGLSHRLQSDTAKKTRAASVEVRRRLAEQWDAA